MLVVLLLSGCNASRQIKDDTATNNSSVESIEKVLLVKEPSQPSLPRMTYKGPAFSLGIAIGGIIGGAIADGDNSVEDALEEYFKQNEINIDLMLYSSLVKGLNEANLPIDITSGDGDAKMVIEIKEYGFEKGWGFSKVKPMVSLRTKIIDKNGKEPIQKNEK